MATAGDARRFVDRLAALDSRELDSAYEGAMSVWSELDPAAALDWWSTRPEQRTSSWLGRAVDNLLAVDEARALDAIARLPEHQQSSLRFDIALRHGIDDPNRGLTLIDRIGSAEDRDAAVAQLVTQMAWRAPREALRIAEARELFEASPETAQRLATSWASSDPEAAMAWAESLDVPGWRTRARRGAFSGWLQREPDAAAAWVGRRPPGEERDLGFALLAIQERDGGDARRRWLAGIDDVELRGRLVDELARYEYDGTYGEVMARVMITNQ